MNRLNTIVIVMLLLTAPASAQDARDAAERAKLTGVWTGFAVDGKGENPDRGPVKLELTITAQSMHGIEIKADNRIDHGQGQYTIDLAADPHHLDGTQKNAAGRGRSYLGIYQLEGDTLRWCVSPQKVRPTTFETKKGQFLLILKRQKVNIAPEVLDKDQQASARGMIDRDIARRTADFNTDHRRRWTGVQTRAQWETYRDERLQKLKQSLGDFPEPGKPEVRITSTIEGDGYTIQNILYQSRPGQWVSANLYVPAKPSGSMPGILITHSHHQAKIQSELMDMGMTWARAGCQVLVIDQVGYGERRAHPFHRDADYARPYRASRQDYYFRYDSGVQLQLLGDSLMGWMVWDLMRGVDLLLAREETDPQRIILLGSVAGGGDPAGITAALDPRIAACVPFNFGGPQPETRYPLPEDAETSFNFLLGAYWDSTRGLRLSARDDFPHWVITASLAPRHLIHAHEFSWDGQRDPVWARYQKVWDFYDATDHLGVAHGKGLLKQRPPEASHCSNIGRFHRRMIHPLLDQWFGIKVTEADEYSAPRKSAEMLCLTDAVRQELKPRSLLQLMTDEGQRRVERARSLLEVRPPEQQRQALREAWGRLLGPIQPAKSPTVQSHAIDPQPMHGVSVERLVLEVEPGVIVPAIVLKPATGTRPGPAVIAVAQAGKAAFLKDRLAELQKLVVAGAVVILPDLRGTGETSAGNGRGRDSAATNQSVHLQLFGETVVGQRLRDLRSVLAYARTRADIDKTQILLWGDSFAEPNPPGTDYQVPHAVDQWPRFAEPLGGLLGLLGALYEDDVRAVYIAGGLSDYHGVLSHFAVLVPHDATVPGALTAGDLPAVAVALSPRPVRLEATVNHLNAIVPAGELARLYATAGQQDGGGEKDSLSIFDQRTSAADWLLAQIR